MLLIWALNTFPFVIWKSSHPAMSPWETSHKRRYRIIASSQTQCKCTAGLLWHLPVLQLLQSSFPIFVFCFFTSNVSTVGVEQVGLMLSLTPGFGRSSNESNMTHFSTNISCCVRPNGSSCSQVWTGMWSVLQRKSEQIKSWLEMTYLRLHKPGPPCAGSFWPQSCWGGLYCWRCSSLAHICPWKRKTLIQRSLDRGGKTEI